MVVKRFGPTEREDGYIISTLTVKTERWYGMWGTYISYKGEGWTLYDGYKTEEEANKGHNKYVNMSTEEIERIYPKEYEED